MAETVGIISESYIVELTTEASEAFFNDIAEMFGIDIDCQHQQTVNETVDELKGQFKKLSAYNIVKAHGVLDGSFQLVFDQKGLFTLAGTIVMLPEKRILELAKRGKEADTEELRDAIGEVGNLLIGAWDRIFREQIEGHGHFLKIGTFIGIPWKNPAENIELSPDQDVLAINYDVTVDSYPPFNYTVFFPKSIFEPTTKEIADIIEEAPVEEEVVAAEATEEATLEEPVVEATIEELPVENPEPLVSETAPLDQDQQIDGAEEIIKQEISENAHLREDVKELLPEVSSFPNVCAGDIMIKNIVWIGAEDSVQQAIEKMHSSQSHYLIAGDGDRIEGIVSGSDIAGAISPYVRPMFAKWRRSMDDATFNIKVKWIMTHTVDVVRVDTPLQDVAREMCHTGRRSMLVLDEEGKARGIITVFNIFEALLKGNQK